MAGVYAGVSSSFLCQQVLQRTLSDPKNCSNHSSAVTFGSMSESLVQTFFMTDCQWQAPSTSWTCGSHLKILVNYLEISSARANLLRCHPLRTIVSHRCECRVGPMCLARALVVRKQSVARCTGWQNPGGLGAIGRVVVAVRLGISSAVTPFTETQSVPSISGANSDVCLSAGCWGLEVGVVRRVTGGWGLGRWCVVGKDRKLGFGGWCVRREGSEVGVGCECGEGSRNQCAPNLGLSFEVRWFKPPLH